MRTPVYPLPMVAIVLLRWMGLGLLHLAGSTEIRGSDTCHGCRLYVRAHVCASACACVGRGSWPHPCPSAAPTSAPACSWPQLINHEAEWLPAYQVP